ncbi:MAG: Aspartyl aminopeptidase [Clostridiales bacterium]|jgi:aspartyl aminopeptidase|nr:Aspartyl aminopeptidase [Clostridiales bacterium]
MKYIETAEKLLNYISKATTAYQAADEFAKKLELEGFQKLNYDDELSISKGGKYYISPYATMCVAFQVGEKFDYNQSFKIIAGHLDSPCFKVKPSPEMYSNGYRKLNIEPYGGMIMYSWLDRPLSLAGQVALKSDNVFKPEMRLVDFKRPLLIIPSLAIHQNREVNKGYEFDSQIDLLPIIGTINETLNNDSFFIDLFAKEMNVEKENILDFDLYLYLCEDGVILGMDDEFISAPRLDDLAMCYAAIESLIASNSQKGINLVALFDNEEVGSGTKAGAGNSLLNNILFKIVEALGYNKSNYDRALRDSFMLSADAAHAVHPNKGEKTDPTNKPVLGGGIIIKQSASQKYISDAESSAIFQQICQKGGINYQRFVNKSGLPGGSTLGPLISQFLQIKGLDVGTPMLSMHSAKELISIDDQENTINCFKAFFEA